MGLITVALLSGCRDDFDPDGRAVEATLELVGYPVPLGVDPPSATPQPFAAGLGHREWNEVVPVLPFPLPRPLDQGSDCLTGVKVTVRVSSGDYIEYGPCRRPREIEPLRRTLQRMLRRRLVAEQAEARYPVGARLESQSGEAVSVRFGEEGWGEAASVIPHPLPRSAGISPKAGCRTGFYKVTVFVLSGDGVEYGPCGRPPEIEPLRRALLRMLRGRRPE